MKHHQQETARFSGVLSLCLCLFLMASCGNEPKEATVKNDSASAAPSAIRDTVPAVYIQPPPGADTAFKEFAFIINDEFIILSATPDTNWIKGKPKLMENGDEGVYSVLMDVNTDQLPAFYRDLLNKKFRVFAKDGSMAVVQIAFFKMYSACIPHFGQVQQWNGSDGSDEKPYTEEQKALDIKHTGALYLVAGFKMEKRDEGLKALAFATPEANEAPFLYRTSAVIEEDKKKIKSLLFKTPEYEEIQKEYASQSHAPAGNWWEDETADERSFFFEGNDGKWYAAMTHRAGEFCGGEFSADKISFWRVDRAAPELLHMMSNTYTVLLVTDIDRNGEPEFLVNNGYGKYSLLKKNGKDWIEAYSWNTPFLDCPC